MLNKNMFDVILFSDSPHHGKSRGHGAHTISSSIRERGYSCLVIDHMSSMTYELYCKLLDLALGENTLVVGYSTTWSPTRSHPLLSQDTLGNAFSNHALTKWFDYPKSRNKNLKIVLGGAKIPLYRHLEVDYVVKGLGETMFMDLLNSISGKGPQKVFDKLLDYDSDAKDPSWDFRESLTTYTEFDIVKPEDALTTEIGRGCRFKCKFCSYPLIGQKNIKDYLRKPEIIKKELLTNYERWGTTKYYIVDDTFNDSVEKIQMMVDITRSLPFQPEYWAFTRLDLTMAFPETIPLLKEMGLRHTYIGVETFHDMAGKIIGKGMPREKRMAGLKQLQDGWNDVVHIQAGFIVGLPHETQESINMTVDYLKQDNCPIHAAWLYPLMLKSNHPDSSKSIFDIDHLKYGYHFPDKSKPDHWEKHDDSDISNFQQASEIAAIANKQIKKTFFPGFVFENVFDYHKFKGLSRVRLDTAEYAEAIHNSDTILAEQNKVFNSYFIPLLQKLESAKKINYSSESENYDNFRLN